MRLFRAAFCFKCIGFLIGHPKLAHCIEIASMHEPYRTRRKRKTRFFVGVRVRLRGQPSDFLSAYPSGVREKERVSCYCDEIVGAFSKFELQSSNTRHFKLRVIWTSKPSSVAKCCDPFFTLNCAPNSSNSAKTILKAMVCRSGWWVGLIRNVRCVIFLPYLSTFPMAHTVRDGSCQTSLNPRHQHFFDRGLQIICMICD